MTNTRDTNSSYKSKPDIRFYSLYNKFKDSFFLGTKFSYSFQWSKTVPDENAGYNPYEAALTQELLIEHFYSSAIKIGYRFRGSIGVIPTFQEKYLKWVCFDLDSAEETKTAEDVLIPALEKHGIQYLKELGGDSLDRLHLWIKVESEQSFAKEFFSLIIQEAHDLPNKDKCFQIYAEVFGINKPKNLIRMPLGFHLKRGKRFPFVRTTSGELSYDPSDFMEDWINMTPLTEERMKEIFKDINVASGKVEKIPASYSRDKAGVFSFFPRMLRLPVSDIPENLVPVVRNCQAINHVIKGVLDDQMIETPGERHHSAGLYLAGLAAYSDGLDKQRKGKSRGVGRKWFNWLRDTFRMRSPKSHQWDTSFKTAETKPDRVFASCKAWEEKFNQCEGCPFKNKITTPKQFIFGQPITRELQYSVKLTTAEEIRRTTFVECSRHLRMLAENNREDNILLASPMGSGKSFWVNQEACWLAKQGFKVLIAVPSTKLALEHQKRLKECGEHSFVLASHVSIFENGISPFPCPEFDEIQSQINLGVSSSTIKSSFCKGCPKLEECYYPNQYKEVMEDHHKIVIIQHAHFSTPEVIYKLMAKNFDVLFIDETFVKECYSALPINDIEMNILESFEDDIVWAGELFSWLSGKSKPTMTIDAKENDLSALKLKTDASGLAWRIPQLIRLYNQKRTVNPDLGIEVIHEIPDIGIKVFTDATPPEGLIKHLTGISRLTVFGRGEILDHKKIHPDNKVIQVLDNSTSVTSLSNEEKFNDIMMKICELAELVYTNHKILLTVYKKDIPRVETFFKMHEDEFPNASKRITVDLMNKGTNAYEEYDVQFLFAGVYAVGSSTRMDAYEYKTVANHYRLKNHLDIIQNIYPGKTTGNVSFERVPVTRVEAFPGGAGVFTYPYVTTPVPTDTWHQYSYEFNVATTQQAIRLRFKPNKPRTIYILNNMFFPTLLISESIVLDQFVEAVKAEEIV